MSIQSVDRALQILTLFSHRRPVLGISEISRAVALPKATAHGLVRTLLNQGFLQQEAATKKYRLGLKIYEMGVILAGTLEINQKAIGPVNKLSRRVGLLSRVAVWDGESVFITLNVYPRPRAVLPNQIGPRVHAYCSGVGKAVLAFLEKPQIEKYLKKNRLRALTTATLKDPEALLSDLALTRERGFSIDHEEVVQGMGCIGAPIFAREGHVVGSISLSGAVAKVLGERLENLSTELLETASQISQQLGYYPALGGSDLL
jgi:IclR family transcriptional regulator, KDG regulon repressor